MAISVADIELHAAVHSPVLGNGVVIDVDSQPSIRVEFDKAGKRWLTQSTAEHYKVETGNYLY